MEKNKFAPRKGLVALDFSETDQSILSYLHFWMQEIACHEYHFLHVVHRPTSWAAWLPWNRQEQPASNSAWSVNNERLREDMEKSVTKHLLHNGALQLSYEVSDGDPLEKMMDSVQRNMVDFVVLGKKVDAAAMGVLVRNAVRKINCPVLVVPQNAAIQLKTIVVPIDFSDFSARALQAALEINNRLAKPAEILALHLYEFPNINHYHIQKTEEQLRESVHSDVHEALQAFIKHHAGNLYDLVEPVLIEHRHGSLGDTLLKAIKGLEADLVLMGAKGHSLVERLLLGSVTERFLQINQHCCTLVVRS